MTVLRTTSGACTSPSAPSFKIPEDSEAARALEVSVAWHASTVTVRFFGRRADAAPDRRRSAIKAFGNEVHILVSWEYSPREMCQL